MINAEAAEIIRGEIAEKNRDGLHADQRANYHCGPARPYRIGARWLLSEFENLARQVGIATAKKQVLSLRSG